MGTGDSDLITCNYWPMGNFNVKLCRPYASEECGDTDRSRCTIVPGWKPDADAKVDDCNEFLVRNSSQDGEAGENDSDAVQASNPLLAIAAVFLSVKFAF